MNIKHVRKVALRTFPLMVAVVAASIHPALAATTGAGALAGIETGATQVQTAMQGIGWAGAIIGVVFAGLHLAQHRDDWSGTGLRIVGAVAAGVVVANAPAIAAIGGTGALF